MENTLRLRLTTRRGPADVIFSIKRSSETTDSSRPGITAGTGAAETHVSYAGDPTTVMGSTDGGKVRFRF